MFHLEKEEKAEQAVRDKNFKENVGGKLMNGSGDEFDDDDDNDDVVGIGVLPKRALELVDRTLGKPHKPYNKMTTETVMTADDDDAKYDTRLV